VYYNETYFYVNLTYAGLVQNWGFDNRNYYGLDWNNLQIQQSWSLDEFGTYSPLGTAYGSGTFHTDRRQTINLNITLELTNLTYVYDLYMACNQHKPMFFLADGSVDFQVSAERTKTWQTLTEVECT